MGAFGGMWTSMQANPVPGAMLPPVKKSAYLQASNDPDAFTALVDRYRKQYGTLPMALRAAAAGGEGITSSGVSGMANPARPPARTAPVSG